MIAQIMTELFVDIFFIKFFQLIQLLYVEKFHRLKLFLVTQ